MLGIVQRSTGPDIEFKAMPRTAKHFALLAKTELTDLGFDIGAAQDASGELGAVVRADVPQGIELGTLPADHYPAFADDEGLHLTRGDIVDTAHAVETRGHGVIIRYYGLPLTSGLRNSSTSWRCSSVV